MFTWNGVTFDLLKVREVEGDFGNTTVRVHMLDGTEHVLRSYPGEGLYQRVTSFWAAEQDLERARLDGVMT